MKILLTGATGLIGTKLAHRLAQDGHSLVILSRNPEKAKSQLKGLSADHFAWSAEATPPQEALRDLDAVIHLAGESIAGRRWNEEYKKRIRDSRVKSTRLLVDGLRALSGKKPSVFISASAMGYYGDRGDEILDESASPGDDFLAQLCIDWERKGLSDYGADARHVLLRTTTVLSHDGGALKQMETPFKLGLGGPLGSGKQWMSWIHIDDEVEAIVHCLRTPSVEGAVNLSSPNPVTNREFTRAFANTLHRPAIFPVPQFALRFAMGEIAPYLLASQRIHPGKLLATGFRFRFETIGQAFAEIFSTGSKPKTASSESSSKR